MKIKSIFSFFKLNQSKVMKFKYFVFCILVTLVSSCDKEENVVPELDTKPQFQFNKEKVYLFDVKLYSDVIHFFKYNTIVTQTNPNCSVSPEYIKHLEDSINSILTIASSKDQKIVIDNIGFDINENEFNDYKLSLNVWSESNPERNEYGYVTSKYAKLGRDSIINLFNRQNLSGHFTTFENRPTTFRPIFDMDYRNHPVGFEEGDDPFFVFVRKLGENDYTSDIQVPANASFKLPTVVQKPEVNQNEHAMVYDRFNERVFECEDGTKYKTTVVVKKLKDIKDFDATAPYPDKPDISKTYPVMQFYKNGELWLEAWISKYTEYFEYNRQDNKTTTEVEFDCNTLKNGYHYWITYEEHKLIIYVSDFSKPNGGDTFTRVDTQYIRFVNDKKDNAKATISVE